MLSVTVFSIIAGGCTTAFGQYAPWIILGSILTSIGSGLISTFNPGTGIGKWLGYQIIYGAGVGTGIQSPLIGVQVVLDKKDIATGYVSFIADTFHSRPLNLNFLPPNQIEHISHNANAQCTNNSTAIIIFFQTFGGAICIAIAQNIFINKLYTNMVRYAPAFPADIVAAAGATELKKVVPAQFYPSVVRAYSESLDSTFYVAVALAVASLAGAVWVEWRSVKGKKIEMGGA